MNLPILIELAVSRAPRIIPIPAKEVLTGMAFLPLFFSLQVLFLVFWFLRTHREKLILLFINSLVVGVASVYALITMKLEWVLNFPVIFSAIEFVVVYYSKSVKQKKDNYHSSGATNLLLIAGWIAAMILVIGALFMREIRWYWWSREDRERLEQVQQTEKDNRLKIKGRIEAALAAKYSRQSWNENQQHFEVYDEHDKLFYVGSDYKNGGCIWAIRAINQPVMPGDTAARLDQLHLLDAFLTLKQRSRLQLIVSDGNFCCQPEKDDDYWFPCDQQFVEVHFDRSNHLLKAQLFGSEQTSLLSESPEHR